MPWDIGISEMNPDTIVVKNLGQHSQVYKKQLSSLVFKRSPARDNYIQRR